MRTGENTTFVGYTLLESNSDVAFDLKRLVSYRNFHSATHAGSPPNEWRMRIVHTEHGVCVAPFDGAVPFYLQCKEASVEPQHSWYRDFFYPQEQERGLDDHEDLLLAAIFHAALEPSKSVTMVLSTEARANLYGPAALLDETRRQSKILATSKPLLATSKSPAMAASL